MTLVAPPGTFRRALFAHEERAGTDFVAMAADWRDATGFLVSQWRRIRGSQIAELVVQVVAAVDAGDVGALAALLAPVGEGADLLETSLAAIADRGAARALGEAAGQGVEGLDPPDMALVADKVAGRAQVTDRWLATGLEQSATQAALQRAGLATDGTTVGEAVRRQLQDLSDRTLQDQIGGAVVSADNDGRVAVFEQAAAANIPTRYYASELLDDATCANCAGVDGREFGSLREAELSYPDGGYSECLGGQRCRGTLVAVYLEAAPSVPRAA